MESLGKEKVIFSILFFILLVSFVSSDSPRDEREKKKNERKKILKSETNIQENNAKFIYLIHLFKLFLKSICRTAEISFSLCLDNPRSLFVSFLIPGLSTLA